MKYTLTIEDMPNGGVRVSPGDVTFMHVGEIAKGFATGTPAFDYLAACMNTCKLRSEGVSREAEARVRKGLIEPIVLFPGSKP